MIRTALSLLMVPVLLAQEKQPATKAPPPVKPPVEHVVQKAQDGDHGDHAVTVGATGQGNAWFPVLERDLGTYFHHEHAVGRFSFKNPKNEAVEWRSLLASCQCSKALVTVGDRHYELSNKPTPNALFRVEKNSFGAETRERVAAIPVGPGESGEVEVHMEMNGVSGLRQASIDIHTTDSENQLMKLRFHATGAQLFVISPGDVSLNQMTWNESREFTVTVTSPVQKDFNITGMDDAGSDFKVSYEKTLRGDVAVWTIQGTYGPVASELGSGGVLRFHTDLQNGPTFQVRVSAFVKGPLELKPGTFLNLGMIRKGTVKKERVVFESNDGEDLDAVAIRFEKLTAEPQFVVAHKSKDGKNLVLELEIVKDAPTGLIRGDMVVELNHPVIKEKRILFNGFVR